MIRQSALRTRMTPPCPVETIAEERQLPITMTADTSLAVKDSLPMRARFNDCSKRTLSRGKLRRIDRAGPELFRTQLPCAAYSISSSSRIPPRLVT